MVFCVLLTSLHCFSQTSTWGTTFPFILCLATVFRPHADLDLGLPLLFLFSLFCAASSLLLSFIILPVRGRTYPIILGFVGAPNVLLTHLGMVSLVFALLELAQFCFISTSAVVLLNISHALSGKVILAILAVFLSNPLGSLFRICLRLALPVFHSFS